MTISYLDKLRKPAIGLIWIACIVFVVLQFIAGFQKAHEYAEKPSYARVDTWVKVGNCARERGVLLVLCLEDGKFQPVEAHAFGGDFGHVLLMGLLGKYTNAPINRETLVKINLFVNLIGFAVIVILLIYAGFKIIPIVFAFLASTIMFSDHMGSNAPGGALFLLPDMGPDVIGSSYGIFALALAFPLWLAMSGRRSWSRTNYWLTFPTLTALLMTAYLLRQPIGMIGVITTFIVWLLLVSIRRKNFFKQRIIFTAAIFGSLFLILQGPLLLVTFRSLVYNIKPTEFILSHGFAHNLYLGLGAEDNPWGIEWNDTIAKEHAEARDPEIKYTSNAYYDLLLKLWWEHISSNPEAAKRIYLTKTNAVLDYKPPYPSQIPSLYQFSTGISLFMLCFIALMVWLVNWSKFYRATIYNQWLILFVVLIFLLGFLAQGVLAVPDAIFLFPSAVGNLLLWALVTEYLLIMVYRVTPRVYGVTPKVYRVARTQIGSLIRESTNLQGSVEPISMRYRIFDISLLISIAICLGLSWIIFKAELYDYNPAIQELLEETSFEFEPIHPYTLKQIEDFLGGKPEVKLYLKPNINLLETGVMLISNDRSGVFFNFSFDTDSRRRIVVTGKNISGSATLRVTYDQGKPNYIQMKDDSITLTVCKARKVELLIYSDSYYSYKLESIRAVESPELRCDGNLANR